MVARSMKEQSKIKTAKSHSKSKDKKDETKQNNKRKLVSNDDEYEELGGFDTWDWSEVATPATTLMSDDTSGFLCLEEIDDVEIEYVGDESTGKVAKFKRKKNPNRKLGEKAKPEQPLELEDMEEFYDIDDFNEKLVNVQPSRKTGQDTKMTSVQEADSAKEVSRSVPEKKKVEKKKDEKKDQKVKKLEKLKAQVKLLEESLENDGSKDEEESSNAQQKNKSKPRISLEDVDHDFDVSDWDSFNLSDAIVNALKYSKFSKPTPIQSKALPLAFNGRDVIGTAETGSGKTLAFGIPIIQHIQANPEAASGKLSGLILTPTRELAIQVQNHIQSMAIFTDIKITAVVGGMSVQKQHRQLNLVPNIIVATPGRFWELFSENETYKEMLADIKFLVLDEADRMLEKGHFDELTNILEAIFNRRQDTTDWPEESGKAKRRVISKDKKHYQTFIYTATLNQGLRFHVKAKQGTVKKNSGTMEELLGSIEFGDPDPALVDVTTENIVASRLKEAKIDCLDTDKDLYVYYFVTRYPGRTIIFVNSIDAIRRLVPVFKLLNVEVLGLHAQMQQRQRLKNLDRFKENAKAVLVASDVAARGLDIPLVEHVIHYQLPRSGEIYVHRSGRTARADREGVSLLLSGPKENRIYKTLCNTLRKGKPYPDFPVDIGTMSQMKKRVQLAVEIDKLSYSEKKANHEESWMRNMAKEMDIEVDEDMIGGKGRGSDASRDRTKAKAKALKAQLNELLNTPMLPTGSSRRYLTGGVNPDLVDRLILNESGTVLPGHDTRKAVDDLQDNKRKKFRK